MLAATHIDRLIASERETIRWYLWLSATIFAISATLVCLSLYLGWMSDWGPILGNGFVLLVLKYPVSEVFRRRERLTALQNVRDFASQVSPSSPHATRIEDMVWRIMEKMLGD